MTSEDADSETEDSELSCPETPMKGYTDPGSQKRSKFDHSPSDFSMMLMKDVRKMLTGCVKMFQRIVTG